MSALTSLEIAEVTDMPSVATGPERTIVVEEVTKTYGAVVALDGVSLEIAAGEIHGILGPNGAGKSTLIRLLVGLSTPDRGRIQVGDSDSTPEPGLRLAYQPEEPALYEYLKVTEFLRLAQELSDEQVLDSLLAERLMERYDLDAVAARLIKGLSAGTRRKVAIVAALVQRPDLLVLDEPTNGLDTKAVLRLKEDLRTLRDEGKTVLLSTHILDFAAGLCGGVTLLRTGKVAYSGPVANMPRRQVDTFEESVAALLGI